MTTRFAAAEQDINDAFLRWHEARIASCDTSDADTLERTVLDYVVAVALAACPVGVDFEERRSTSR
jgi:hypothetical protein